jgi:hypothetical protein
VRHSRPAKQRLWLGSGRYRGRCRDAVTNRDAESYANSNGYAFCMRRDNAYTDADRHRNCNANSYSYCYSYCYSYLNADSDG